MTDTLTDPRDAEAEAAFRSTPTAIEAFLNVMDEVRAVGKDGQFTSKTVNYSFRGIDGVVNAVGPALRKHRVLIVPTVLEAAYQTVEAGSNRTLMRECTVKVRYRVYGPRGDWFDGEVYGEALDSSDKGTAKATSVAYRIFLLQSLTIPTHEPDPDESRYERASAPEYVEDPLPGLRSAVQAAIDKYVGKDEQRDAEKAGELEAFFRDNNLPAVKRMNAAQTDVILDHLFTLPAPTPDTEGAE